MVGPLLTSVQLSFAVPHCCIQQSASLTMSAMSVACQMLLLTVAALLKHPRDINEYDL